MEPSIILSNILSCPTWSFSWSPSGSLSVSIMSRAAEDSTDGTETAMSMSVSSTGDVRLACSVSWTVSKFVFDFLHLQPSGRGEEREPGERQDGPRQHRPGQPPAEHVEDAECDVGLAGVCCYRIRVVNY